MDEYIKKEAVINFIENGLNNPDKTKSFGHDAIEIMAEVQYMPAADVTEVRRGKWLTWEEQFPDRKPTKKNNLGVFCNNCHSHADNMTNYCPNCGARMDGATDTNVGGKLKEGAEE